LSFPSREQQRPPATSRRKNNKLHPVSAATAWMLPVILLSLQDDTDEMPLWWNIIANYGFY